MYIIPPLLSGGSIQYLDMISAFLTGSISFALLLSCLSLVLRNLHLHTCRDATGDARSNLDQASWIVVFVNSCQKQCSTRSLATAGFLLFAIPGWKKTLNPEP